MLISTLMFSAVFFDKFRISTLVSLDTNLSAQIPNTRVNDQVKGGSIMYGSPDRYTYLPAGGRLPVMCRGGRTLGCNYRVHIDRPWSVHLYTAVYTHYLFNIRSKI